MYHYYISALVLQVKDNNLMQESQFLSWAVTQHVCQPFFDLVPVRLSVCFNTICHCRLCACLSVCSSICSIRQSIPLVFDSWCVILSVSEWCHSGAVCQGRKPRCHHQLFFLTSPLFCHPTPSSLGSLRMHVLYMCMLKNMHLENGYRYAHVHAYRWYVVMMQMFNLRCRSGSTVWPVALLWSNCEVF